MYVFASPVHFILQKEICLGSMIVKSIGRIFNTPGIKKNSRESYMIPARNANILMRL